MKKESSKHEPLVCTFKDRHCKGEILMTNFQFGPKKKDSKFYPMCKNHADNMESFERYTRIIFQAGFQSAFTIVQKPQEIQNQINKLVNDLSLYKNKHYKPIVDKIIILKWVLRQRKLPYLMGNEFLKTAIPELGEE